MKARTRGRIARIAAEQGWHEWSTIPNSSYLRRGTTSINLGFSRSGQLSCSGLSVALRAQGRIQDRDLVGPKPGDGSTLPRTRSGAGAGGLG